MAIPEDIVDLWNEFPLQLKIEPLDDLFDSEPKAVLTKNAFESITSVPDDKLTETQDVDTNSIEKARPEGLKGNSLEVVGSENAVVGGIYEASKLYAYEDFLSFLAREGGIDQDRLSILVGDMSPRPDEDFVAFLARSNGIKDEQMINRLRQALKLETVIDFEHGRSKVPVKMEVDSDLKVREGEDAASFFRRAGSWESASSVSEELASVGLDELADEDAESFFRRTESAGDVDLDGEYVHGSGVPLISTKADVDSAEDQPSLQVSVPIDSSELDSKNEVAVKKRKLADE